jgi:hypothetical protein
MKKNYLVTWTVDGPCQAGGNTILQLFKNKTFSVVKQECEGSLPEVEEDDDQLSSFDIKEITPEEAKILAKFVSNDSPCFPE